MNLGKIPVFFWDGDFNHREFTEGGEEKTSYKGTKDNDRLFFLLPTSK